MKGNRKTKLIWLVLLLFVLSSMLVKSETAMAEEKKILLQGNCGEYQYDDDEYEYYFNGPSVKFVLYEDGTP